MCSGTGCARCTRGRVVWYERDGYDKHPEPIIDIEPETGALSSSERERVVELGNMLSGKIVRVETVYAPELRERRNGLSPVERTTMSCLRWSDALDWLEDRLDSSPVWVQEGAVERDDEAVAWLAKRLLESGVRVTQPATRAAV